MVAGMVVSMAAAMAPADLALTQAARLGLYSGLGTVVLCYAANVWIQGRASRWTS